MSIEPSTPGTETVERRRPTRPRAETNRIPVSGLMLLIEAVAWRPWTNLRTGEHS